MRVNLTSQDKTQVAYLREFLINVDVSSEPRQDQDVLLYWTDATTQKASYHIFNSPQARQVQRDEAEAERLLSLNRLLTPKDMKSDVIRLKARYKVDVFDTKVVRVLVKKGKSKPPMVVNDVEGKFTSRVCEIARAALYSLGLDFGAVFLGVDTDSKKIVLAVEPTPYLSTKMARYYGDYIMADLELIKKELEYKQTGGLSELNNRFLMGADPEFMVYDTRSKRWLIASDYFPKQGSVGTDARAIYSPKHGYPLAELRPEPADNPLTLVNNIKQTMVVGINRLPCQNTVWVAGSCPMSGFPIGGHIHFTGIKANNRLLRALDNYFSIPMLMLENQRTTRQRRERYGMLGDFRFKSHGGFEYRTPASWIVSEQIATGALSLAALIAQDYPLLKQDHLFGYEAQRAFYQCDKENFREVALKLWADVIKCPTYARYKTQLRIIEDMLDKGEEWKEKVDIRRTWKIPIPRRMCSRL